MLWLFRNRPQGLAVDAFELPKNLLAEVSSHAEREYPNECCGMILVERDSGDWRVRACENAQDRYHAIDPNQFPRTSMNAYFFDSKEVVAIDRELRERGEKIYAIYHSHPDADAYFSKEDSLRAVMDGEAIYPDAAQLVLGVENGSVHETAAFRWCELGKSFERVDVRLVHAG
ncbi:MAG: hypothetical protein CMO80_12780 [Verrucomicrobiales bacterium]|nr:hypothetical protein [Verrucomicrobiales bacterium]